MGDIVSAQRDNTEDTESQAQDSDAEDKLFQNNEHISGLHGKSDDLIAELKDHLEDEVIDEVCDTESALFSAREEVSDTFETVDDKEALLEYVEIDDRTDSDPEADEEELNENEDRMNEINRGFRKFFSNIGLRLNVKQETDDKQAETASDEPVMPDAEEEPSYLGDTCDMANESASETAENNADLHVALDSADNESTTCPTVTDMTSEEIQENTVDKTTAATEVDQEAAETILALGDTEGFITLEVEPEASSPQNSAEEEEVLSPIKVFFTTGIFSSLRRKKKPTEEENRKNETNEEELVDMIRQEQGRTEELGKDLAKVKICQSAVVEEKPKTEEENEVILESAQTTNGHEFGENLLTSNEELLLGSQEKVKVPSSPLQRLFSGNSFKKVSTKQRGRKSSDSTERVSDLLQSSVESAKSTTDKESPSVAAEEENKSEEGAWESFKRLLTPKKFQKCSILSTEEDVVSSTPEEPKPSGGEEIADVNSEESRKRKDSIVSWDALLCGSGNRRSRKSSNADEQKPKAEGDDNRPASESRHATDLESSHEIDDNRASSPEQGGSPSEDEGSTWKSFKRLVTPKRKSRDGEETKEHTSDSEIIQDESSFSLKKFLPGRKKRRASEKQGQVPSDKPEREAQSDEEDSETPAVIPLSEFDIPETESQVKTQAVIESQTPEEHEEQEKITGQTTEAIIITDNTPALPEESKDNEIALEKPTSTTPASTEEVDDLTELISKLQQLSDIPEEGLIEESIASPASFAEDAARDDTIADIVEFTSEAVTAPEPIDITAEDETEMVSAASQLTDSSKTSGNATPVPVEYHIKETDYLLHQVVESISATPNEALMSISNQSPERNACCVSHQILETSISKELLILQPHQTSDATLLCTGLTLESFDAIDRVVVMAESECLSEMTEAISTQCLSEDTTEEFHTAGISVDEEFKYVKESQPVVYSSYEENKAITSEVSPQAEDVHVAEIPIDNHKHDNEQANAMAPPGTNSHVEATILNHNEALSQTNVALENKHDQIKESTTEVQIDEMVDESETLTLTDACVSINSEEVSGAQADEMPATSEATPTDETAKVTDLLRAEQMQDVGDKEHELLVVKVDDAEDEDVPASAPVDPAEVIIEADKSNSQLQSCSSVDIEKAQQGSVQELDSQFMTATKYIPVLDSTVPDITCTEKEGESVALGQMQHTLDTEMYMDAAEILKYAQVDGGDQKTEVKGELQTETTVEETVFCEESNVPVLEHKVITEDSPELEKEKDDEKETVMQPEQSLMEKDLATVENEPTEVAQHISVEEEGQPVEGTIELEEVMSIHMASLNDDVAIIQAVEKLVMTEDNSQGENASSTSEFVKEAAMATEQCLADKELVSIENDPCNGPRQVLLQEDGQVTDEFETLQSVNVGTLNSEARIVEVHQKLIISEDIGSHTENASTLITDEDEKETIQSEQSLLEKEFATVPADCGQSIEVTNALEESIVVHVASVNCDGTVLSLERQVFTEDKLEYHAENAIPSSTSEFVKETAMATEQSLVEKELFFIENDCCDVSQCILVQEDGKLTDVTNELETLNSLHVASVVNLEVGIALVLEKQVLMDDNAENALPSSMSNVEKEAVTEHDVADKELTSLCVASVISDVSIIHLFETQEITEDNAESYAENATSKVEQETAIVTKQGLAETELVPLDNDPCEVPRQVLLQEDGKLTEGIDGLETFKSVNEGSLNSEAGIVEVYEKQVTPEDLRAIAGNANTAIRVEDEKEPVTPSEQSLLEKCLVTVENNPSEETQHISLTEYVQVVEAEIETSACARVASSVEVLEQQVVSEDIPVPNGASVKTENETGVLIEQVPVEKSLPTVDDDDHTEIPQQSVAKEDCEAVKVSTVQIAPLILEPRIVEVIEKLITSEALRPIEVNANTLITVGNDKESVTHSDQSLLENELVTVESNLNEEPQHISVTDDVQVAEVTKELEASTSVHAAYADSNVGFVEVLEKQVVSEDIPVPDGVSVLGTVEVEKGTVVMIEQALEGNKIPTVDDEANDISHQSVVKEDGEAVKVSMEFETPPAVQISPLILESSFVEVIEKQATSEALGSIEGKVNTLITVGDNTETQIHSEQSLLEKELVTVESNLNEEPQCISVTGDFQVTEVTKELEASTSVHEASVDSNAGIVKVLENKVVSDDIPVPDGTSTSMKAEVEDETEVLIQQALVEKELPTMDDDLNEISQQSVTKEDGEVVKVSTEREAPPRVHIARLILESSVVEVIEKQVLPESASTIAEREAVVLIEQALVGKEHITVVDDPNEVPRQCAVKNNDGLADMTNILDGSTAVHIASITSDTSTPQVLEKHVLPEAILALDKKNALDSNTAEVEHQVVLTEHVVLIQIIDGDPNAAPRYNAVKNNDQLAEATKLLEAPTAANRVSIAPETTVPQVIEKHILSENIAAPDTENNVAFVVPEPSHEVVPTAKVETNTEVVEDGAAMQAFTCGTKDMNTSTPNGANTETPNITEPLLNVATEEEPQETIESVRILKPCVQKDMMEMAEESKGKADAEVKSPEEGGFTDVQEDMIETAEESKGKVESEVNLPEEGGVTDVQEDMIELGEESKDKVEAEVKSPDKGGVADVQEGMIETAEESKGEVDAAVKTTEEVEVTDANKAIDICCKDEHEVENVSTSLATEKEIIDETDKVTTKEVERTQTTVSEEEAKEESCLDEEPVSAEQFVSINLFPPTVEQEATAITQSEPSELEAQKVTEKKSDALTERQPGVLSETQTVIEVETASPNVLATTDNVSIDEPKTVLEDTEVQLKNESDVLVIEEDSSCSPEVLAVKEMIEAKPEQTCQVVMPGNMGIVVPQIIISFYEVQPTITMGETDILVTENVEPNIQMVVTEPQLEENVEPNIQMVVTEPQLKENVEPNIQIVVTEPQPKEKVEPTIQIMVTEPQLKEKVEPNIKMEVTELETEQKGEPLNHAVQVSEVRVQIAESVRPEIKMEVTELQATERVESTIKMEGTECQVTEKVEHNIKIEVEETKDTEVRPEVVIQAMEAIVKEVSMVETKTDLEETKIELNKESDVQVIEEDYSCSPEQTFLTSCQVVTPRKEGEPTIKMEVTDIQQTEKRQPKIQREVTELKVKAKVEPTINMEATEIPVTEKVEPNIEIAATEMKDSTTQPEQPDVGVQAAEAMEPERPIKTAEVAESLKEPGVSEIAVTQVIEVTALSKDSTTREMILAEPVALQVSIEQVKTVEATESTGIAIILSQTVLTHSVVEPLETTKPDLVHIEQAERTVMSNQLVQSEVGVEVSKHLRQGDEEDIGKIEGSEKTDIEPQDSVESQVKSSQGDIEAEILDATEHAHIKGESSPAEKATIGAKCELVSKKEDFAFALEDLDMMNLTETSVIYKEQD